MFPKPIFVIRGGVIYASTKLLSVIGNSSGKFNFCAMSLASWMINPNASFRYSGGTDVND